MLAALALALQGAAPVAALAGGEVALPIDLGALGENGQGTLRADLDLEYSLAVVRIVSGHTVKKG